MEKQLVGAGKLGGTESLGSPGWANSVSQFDGVSDMVPASWLCGSVGQGFSKGTIASALLSVPQLSPG